MIIGYYEQSYFSGGTYIKLSKRETENYKIEYLHSDIPNYVPNAESFVRSYETFRIEEDNFIDYLKDKLVTRNIDENMKTKELIHYIRNINFEKLSKKKYDDEEVDDGLCWECFIELDEKSYHIEGYENQPKEVKKIKELLEQLY